MVGMTCMSRTVLARGHKTQTLTSVRRAGRHSTGSRATVHVRAVGEYKPDSEDTAGADSAESMFAQELARRGLAENGSVEGGPSAMERLKRAAGKAMPPAFAPNATPSATPRQDEIDNQLEKSRKLNAEGLEVRSVIERRHRMGSDASGTDMQGFPTRAGELLKLGGTFFLGFGPLIGVTVGAVALTYLAFGSDFIHGGTASGPPAYLEPNELLNERTVDTMVPLQTPKTQADYYNY